MSTELPPPAAPSPPWRVKFDGTCSRCGMALRVGEVAIYERSTRSIRCVECPTAQPDEAAESDLDAGVAGGSARREYERRKGNRETRVKDRFGGRLGGVVLAVTHEPQSTRAWGIGAVGEEKLAKALEGVEGLRILHDRRVPGTRGNIDHIVVGPAGVFVVDAKRYQGKIEVRNRGWFLRPDPRLYVGRRDCSALAEGLGWQVDAVTAALVTAGVDPLPPVTPVLCFVDGEWPLLFPPNSYAGARLEGAKSIRKLFAALEVLDAETIDRLTHALAAALPAKWAQDGLRRLTDTPERLPASVSGRKRRFPAGGASPYRSPLRAVDNAPGGHRSGLRSGRRVGGLAATRTPPARPGRPDSGASTVSKGHSNPVQSVEECAHRLRLSQNRWRNPGGLLPLEEVLVDPPRFHSRIALSLRMRAMSIAGSSNGAALHKLA